MYPTTHEEALAFESQMAKLVAENMQNSKKERSIATFNHLQDIGRLVPRGLYRHFKGGEYEVFGVREDVNTGMCYVEYAAQYGLYKDEPALRILVGPDSFLRPIDRPEYKGVRFTLLGHTAIVDID